MEPLAIIVLEDDPDVHPYVVQIFVQTSANLFPLQSLEEALAAGIVVRVRRAAHARDRPVLGQDSHVVIGSILHSAVGVMYQTRMRLSLCNRLLQRRDWQPRYRCSGQFPANHFANASALAGQHGIIGVGGRAVGVLAALLPVQIHRWIRAYIISNGGRLVVVIDAAKALLSHPSLQQGSINGEVLIREQIALACVLEHGSEKASAMSPSSGRWRSS